MTAGFRVHFTSSESRYFFVESKSTYAYCPSPVATSLSHLMCNEDFDCAQAVLSTSQITEFGLLKSVTPISFDKTAETFLEVQLTIEVEELTMFGTSTATCSNDSWRIVFSLE